MQARPLAMTQRQALRLQALRHRLVLAQNRSNERAWQVTRRERTRRLIELGGLIVKSRIDTLVDDDRAVIFGILNEAAARLNSEDVPQQILLWRRRGQRAFNAAAEDGTVVSPDKA